MRRLYEFIQYIIIIFTEAAKRGIRTFDNLVFSTGAGITVYSTNYSTNNFVS